jgi:hypothetical protein
MISSVPNRSTGLCENWGLIGLVGSRTNQTARRSLHWLLESGNEPGPAGAKSVAQPSSRHAIIFSFSPEPHWPDASAGVEATVHR